MVVRWLENLQGFIVSRRNLKNYRYADILFIVIFETNLKEILENVDDERKLTGWSIKFM